MKFVETTFSFKHSGIPVTRRTLKCQTPLGMFSVFESVGGKIFIRHPFISKPIGLQGYDPDPDNEFSPAPRIQVSSIEEGVKKLEIKWAQVVEAINKV